MRINLVRIISYLFLAATVVVAFNVQDLPFKLFFSSPQKTAEQLTVTNTMTLLNEEYELVLLDRMSALERQRLELINRIESDDANDINLALQAELKKLQDEQNLLKLEITTVRQPVVIETATQLVFSGELEAMKMQLQQKQDLIAGQEAELEALKLDLETYIAQKEDLELEIIQKNRQIANIRAELAGYKAELGQPNELQAVLAESEKEIAELENTITVQTREIESLNSKISAGDQRNDELMTELGKKELQAAELRTELDRINAELTNADEEEGIIEKLFAASNIRGMFILEDDSPKPRLIVNPNLIESALESPSVDVFHHDGTLVSKIIVSNNNGVFQFKAFPGYPDPAEGNWF